MREGTDGLGGWVGGWVGGLCVWRGGGGSQHPTGGRGNNLPRVFWPLTGGPAHGQHPRFVVAEIWADQGGGGGIGGLAAGGSQGGGACA